LETEEASKNYLNSAFSVLFDVLRINKIKVWSLDIAVAIKGIIKEIREKGKLDFEMFGVALLSAAIIYRKKTEELLELEEPPRSDENHKNESYDVETISGGLLNLMSEIPIRIKHPAPDSNEVFSLLIKVVNQVLRERPIMVQGSEAGIEYELIQKDEFLESIQDRIETLKRKIDEMLANSRRVLLSDIVYDEDWNETMRNFIAILFILSNSDLEVIYEGDSVWITKENNSIQKN
jgi:chromatin segregation and condensation protein Rec8/ScpA/Scc1 (kleisin family)